MVYWDSVSVVSGEQMMQLAREKRWKLDEVVRGCRDKHESGRKWEARLPSTCKSRDYSAVLPSLNCYRINECPYMCFNTCSRTELFRGDLPDQVVPPRLSGFGAKGSLKRDGIDSEPRVCVYFGSITIRSNNAGCSDTINHGSDRPSIIDFFSRPSRTSRQ